ncbi:MAG: C39 family peptidase [Syntrophales bacterium]
MKTAINSTCLKVLVIVISIVLLLAPSHAAKMYKWVDNEGVVHFTDERPEGVDNPQSVRVEGSDKKTDIATEKDNAPSKTKALITAPARTPDSLHKLKNFPVMKQDPNWCALTSIAMIAQYYGYHIDPMQVSIESGIPLEQGMTLEAILKYFEQLKALKLDVSYEYHGTLELIKQNIDNNVPILWLHFVPVGRRVGRHAAVVIGYDDTARKMIVADPAWGAEIAMPYTEFLQRWYGTRQLMIAVTSRI